MDSVKVEVGGSWRCVSFILPQESSSLPWIRSILLPSLHRGSILLHFFWLANFLHPSTEIRKLSSPPAPLFFFFFFFFFYFTMLLFIGILLSTLIFYFILMSTLIFYFYLHLYLLVSIHAVFLFLLCTEHWNKKQFPHRGLIKYSESESESELSFSWFQSFLVFLTDFLPP